MTEKPFTPDFKDTPYWWDAAPRPVLRARVVVVLLGLGNDEAAVGRRRRTPARALPTLSPSGVALVVGDPQDDLALALAAAGVDVERWDRRVLAGQR